MAFYVGNDAVQALIDAIPDWLTNGLTIATGILPALGFAQLMSILSTKELSFLFFGGFLTIGIVAFSLILIGILNMAHIFMPASAAVAKEVDDDNEF